MEEIVLKCDLIIENEFSAKQGVLIRRLEDRSLEIVTRLENGATSTFPFTPSYLCDKIWKLANQQITEYIPQKNKNMATKPHKPVIRLENRAYSGQYVLDYYPIPKPDENDYTNQEDFFKDFDNWKKSKQTVPVAESEKKEFHQLAYSFSTQDGDATFHHELRSGISILSDNIEICRIFDGKQSINDYAFIKKASEEKAPIKESETRNMNMVNEPFKDFWLRLEMFVENVQVNDAMSEEEKSMILNICKQQQDIKNV